MNKTRMTNENIIKLNRNGVKTKIASSEKLQDRRKKIK